jgi:hypothetical protein
MTVCSRDEEKRTNLRRRNKMNKKRRIKKKKGTPKCKANDEMRLGLAFLNC